MQTAQLHKSPVTQNTVGNQAQWDDRKSRSDLFFSSQNTDLQKANQPTKTKAKNTRTTKHPNQNNETNPSKIPQKLKQTKSSQAKVILNNF